jgi:hypothetical protein
LNLTTSVLFLIGRERIGLFCGAFYHFYVHDKAGPIGSLLRMSFPVSAFVTLDDDTFAQCVISVFMQVMGILQLPFVLGPSFSPFDPHLFIRSSPVLQETKQDYTEPKLVNGTGTSSNGQKLKAPLGGQPKSTANEVPGNGTTEAVVSRNGEHSTSSSKKKKQKKKKQS